MEAGKRQLLFVAGSEPMRKEICEYLAAPDLDIHVASSAPEVLEILTAQEIDGIVVDWAVSEVGGVDLLEQIQARSAPFVPPLIVFGPRQLDAGRAGNLH